MLGHERLDEERALLRVEAGADPVGDVLVGVRRQLARVGEVARQRVPVGDEIEAVVLSCSGTQLPSAPTRWPRCSRPVGRMPETTRPCCAERDSLQPRQREVGRRTDQVVEAARSASARRAA